MPAEIHCPKCSSADVILRKKRGAFVCQGFQEAPVSPLGFLLSYGHDANEPLVRRIKTDLEKRRHGVWFDKNEIRPGDNWRRSITEGMMRPIQLLPMAGITFEIVSETVAPIVYCNDQLIQRSEVFVAVPKGTEANATAPLASQAAMAEQLGVVVDRPRDTVFRSHDQEPLGDGEATTQEIAQESSATESAVDIDSGSLEEEENDR